ncbi:MAG TPA: MerR family transcriptional regulator [Acidimicrobiales bacterium]
MTVTEERFRIDELADRAAAALADADTTAGSGRVTPVPDRRMLRYYTTLGLLDRPAEVQGRVAYYGRRHLLQVVAVKRLQAEGLALADVQQRLAGATTAELERIARVPEARAAFWRTVPTPAAPAPAPQPAAEPAELVGAVRLAPGVTLVVDATRPLTDEDARRLQAAAAPILDDLHARGLLPPKELNP